MSVSKIVSDSDIAKMYEAIRNLEGLKEEIRLYDKAKLKTNLSEADIDKKIADIQLMIDTFEGKN